MNTNHVAVLALVLVKLTDRLLMAYERSTPNIDQEFVGRVLGAMDRLKKAAYKILEFHGERQAA